MEVYLPQQSQSLGKSHLGPVPAQGLLINDSCSHVPKPFELGGERVWYTLRVHALEDPRKNGGIRYH